MYQLKEFKGKLTFWDIQITVPAQRCQVTPKMSVSFRVSLVSQALRYVELFPFPS